MTNEARAPRPLAPLSLAAVCLSGCGTSSAPTGELTIAIQAEDSITAGLAAGTAPEQIADGWSVTYDKFIAAFGPIHVQAMAAGGTDLDADANLVIDLRTIPETGRVVRTDSLPEGRYAFGYAMPVAVATMTRDPSVSQADFERMIAEGCSHLVAGSATDGARTIRFDLCLDAEADYACSSVDGMEGIVVSAGARTAFLTVHGDHLFFNGFPAGDEGAVVRRAGWLALVDDATGADGLVDRADLEATPVSILPPSEYPLTGAPTVEGMPITTMSLYARAQLQSQGHLDGEGECIANGVAHARLRGGV